MPVLKARLPDNSWATLGGVGVGIPAGGTTGQVLTKTSAADYATAWGTNTPILANNTYLQGYQSNGTTPQNLIGVGGDNHVYLAPGLSTANYLLAPGPGVYIGAKRTDGTLQDYMVLTAAPDNHVIAFAGVKGVFNIGSNCLGDVYIAPGLTAGKNIYVPRLTVQGALTLGDQQWLQSGSAQLVLYNSSINNMYVAHNCNFHVNVNAGTTIFYKNITVYDTIYKGGSTAYTHPDFVFEHAYRGKIELFATAHGASDYTGLPTLEGVEAHTRQFLRLPGPRIDKYDMFARGDELLAEVEKLYLYLFEHERRLKALEAD